MFILAEAVAKVAWKDMLTWKYVSSQLSSFWNAYGTNVILFLVILIVGRMIAKLLKRVSIKLMERADTDKSIQSFASSLIYITSMIFVIISALGYLGVQTASFVAIIGAAGLAVGLAFQGALSNFAAGFLVIVFKPYSIGDFVEAGGTRGIVSNLQLFTTTLKTPDNKTIIVPNAQMTSGNITNYNKEETRRLDLVFGVSYSDDLEKVKKSITKILKSYKSVLKEPAATVAVSELADSSVNLVVRPWVKREDYWTTHFYLHEKIKKQFDKEGISIPFPQRDLHVYDHKTS